MINKRRLAAVLVLCVVPATLGAAPGRAAAASGVTAKPYPVLAPLAGLSKVGQLVVAGKSLFVSSGPSGSDVRVYAASGALLTNITDIPGADAMVASPDGSTVYVAESTQTSIGVIDTADDSVTTLAVTDCPGSLADVDGRVFYSYGCPGGSSFGINSVDPTTGLLGNPTTGFPSAPLLAGDGDATDPVLSAEAADELTTYQAGADGGLTELGSTSLEKQPEGIAETPTGGEVLAVVDPDAGVSAYDTSTLAVDRTYDTAASTTAVAVDPAGDSVAVGTSGDNETAAMFSAGSTTPNWARFTTDGNPADWKPNVSLDQVLPDTMAFSANGDEVFALVSRQKHPGVYLFAANTAPATSTRATLSAPKVKPGKPIRPLAKLSGLAGQVVPVHFTASHGPSAASRTAYTSSSGRAVASFKPNYSGKMLAVFDGTPGLLPTATSTAYSVGSRTICQLRGNHERRHGRAVYASASQIVVFFRTTPAQASRKAVAIIQVFSRGKWRFVNRLRGIEKRQGIAVTFTSAPVIEKLRVRFRTGTDGDSRGSRVTSPVFELV